MSFETLKACARKLGMYRATRLAYRHCVNRKELVALTKEAQFYQQFIKSGDLCFDVGANYGAKAEVFLRLGARVIAFEPQRDCMQELQARLGSSTRLVPVSAALGSCPGQMPLYIERHRTASSLVKDWQGEVVESVDVSVMTLDQAVVQFGKPDHCKINVEGYELEVLKGLSCAIPSLSFEYHLRRDGVTRAIACLDYLASWGELLVNISPAETPVFATSQWWENRDFLDFFRNEVPQMRGYDYGDIFVKFPEASGSRIEAQPRTGSMRSW